MDDAVPFTVLLPTPRSTPTQAILGPLAPLSEPASGEGRDEQFANAYRWWNSSVSATQPVTVGYHVTVRTSPHTGYDAGNDTPDRGLGTDEHVTPDLERIREITAASMTEDPLSTARALNAYVVRSLTYGDPIDGLYSTSDALTRPRVDCGGFDTLLIALLRAAAIPARLVSGFWLGGATNEMHAWVELRIGNQWIAADPSVEHLRSHGRTRRTGSLGYVGSDRLVLSHGSDIALSVDTQRVRVPLLQTPVVLGVPAGTPITVTRTLQSSRLP